MRYYHVFCSWCYYLLFKNRLITIMQGIAFVKETLYTLALVDQCVQHKKHVVKKKGQRVKAHAFPVNADS